MNTGSTSSGLNTAKRAMAAHMETIKIAGNNITNVNIPGYSRQRLEVVDTSVQGRNMVDMLKVRRVRDQYIDNHIRYENKTFGEWDVKARLYGQMENIFLEPSAHGINAILSEFWNGWADLSNDPDGATTRSVTIQRGIVLTESIKHLDSQLKNFRQFTDRHIGSKISEINSLADRIARANGGIAAQEASGEEASELRDNRDVLLAKLAKLVDITVLERDSGAVTVLLTGRTMVADAESFALGIQVVGRDGMMVNDVIWEDDGTNAQMSGGELNGMIIVRDEVIPDLLQKLDTLASTLIEEVNNIYSTGYSPDGTTGLDFFTGTGAVDISVSTQLTGNTSRLAASDTDEPGGNAIAIALSELSDDPVAPSSMTIGGYYSSMLEDLGTKSRNATTMRDNSEMLLNYLEEQKESISGVSLDEEAADLVRFQHAYQSAARYMSVINDMMKILMDLV